MRKLPKIEITGAREHNLKGINESNLAENLEKLELHSLSKQVSTFKALFSKEGLLEKDNVNFDDLLTSSIDTARYSVDKSNILLSYEGETPSYFDGKTSKYSRLRGLQVNPSDLFNYYIF